MSAFSHPSHAPAGIDREFGLRRVRRRARLGAAIAVAGYAVAFVADLMRATPSDDMVITGLEIAFGCVFTLCALVSVVLWMQAEHVGHALALWTARSAAEERFERRLDQSSTERR